MSSKSLTIPVRVLTDAVESVITVEMKSGELYRGKLLDVEGSMNCYLESVTKTERDGKVTTLVQVFLRGSHIRLFILPELLKHSRVLKGGI